MLIINIIISGNNEERGFAPQLKITDGVCQGGVLSDGVLSGWGFV